MTLNTHITNNELTITLFLNQCIYSAIMTNDMLDGDIIKSIDILKRILARDFNNPEVVNISQENGVSLNITINYPYVAESLSIKLTHDTSPNAEQLQLTIMNEMITSLQWQVSMLREELQYPSAINSFISMFDLFDESLNTVSNSIDIFTPGNMVIKPDDCTAFPITKMITKSVPIYNLDLKYIKITEPADLRDLVEYPNLEEVWFKSESINFGILSELEHLEHVVISGPLPRFLFEGKRFTVTHRNF